MAGEQLAEDYHGAEWLLQIVACRVGELLQIGVGVSQFLFDFLLLRNIGVGTNHRTIRPLSFRTGTARVRNGRKRSSAPRKGNTISKFSPVRIECVHRSISCRYLGLSGSGLIITRGNNGAGAVHGLAEGM